MAGSAENGRDFFRTMLTLGAAAIPASYALLSFLSGGRHLSRWIAALAAVGGALYLASIVVFAVGLKPRYDRIGPDDFDAWRTARLRQMANLSTAGMVLFAVATALIVGLSITLI